MSNNHAKSFVQTHILLIDAIIGFTQDQSAVKKWTLTAHLRSVVHNNTEKKISEDEEKIRKVITAVNENSNPFTINHCTKATLKDIATGHLAK